MRMPSNSSSPVRVSPQQERSARRLAAFLDAAEALFADLGYEATTMQAIAERSQSSIGALYNYFPGKEAVAITLRGQYADQLRAELAALMESSRKSTAAEFTDGFIHCIGSFMRQHPAWLNLHSAPIRVHRNHAARKALRVLIANTFRARNPALTAERAALAANVSVQIVKGMVSLYQETDAKSQAVVEAEFRRVLGAYIAGILSEK